MQSKGDILSSKNILFLFSLFISLFVAAASVNAFYYEINHFYDNTTIPATNSISNVQALVYTCSDAQCANLNSASAPWFNQNSGANNYLVVPYPSTPSIQYYGEYFFKSCYLPKEYITWSYGDGSLDYNIVFNKGKKCHAPITQLSVQNVNYPNMPIAIHLNTSIGSDIYSAFALSGLGPDFVPDAYKAEFYSAETRVVLNIYDQNNAIVHTETRTLNLYAGTLTNLEFFWIPIVPGNYTVVATTAVTDCQCSSGFDESAFKQFTVISQISPAESMCYTLLNNLTMGNPFPAIGQNLSFSLRALSNFFNSTNLALTAIPTFLNIRIYNSTNSLVNSNTALVPGVLSNVFNMFYYSWTPLYSDHYSVSVTGIAQSTLCNGLTNLPETIGQTVFVSSNQTPPPPPANLTVYIVGGPLSGNAPLTTYLNASASSGCSINSYSWDFGDGSSSSLQNVVHTYTSTGIYTAKVTVFDSCSRNASDSVQVSVGSVPPPPPIANLTVSIIGGPFSGSAPLTVNANAVASGTCAVVSYLWNFGDSGSSIDQNITHIYTAVGSYVLNVTAFDSCGRTASDSRTVIVSSIPPPPRHAPKVISIPPTLVKEDSPTRFNATYKYQVVAIDEDNDTLFYYLTVAPDGMFIDSGTGLITWAPNRNQLGYNQVIVVVSDGFLTDNQSYRILVTVPGEDTRPKEKLQLTQLNILNNDECVAPGSTLAVSVGIKNNGYFSMKYTSIIASVPELGLRDKSGPFEIDSDEELAKDLYLDIPAGTPDGFYYLRSYAGDAFYQRIEYREFAVARDCRLFLGCSTGCDSNTICKKQ